MQLASNHKQGLPFWQSKDMMQVESIDDLDFARCIDAAYYPGCGLRECHIVPRYLAKLANQQPVRESGVTGYARRSPRTSRMEALNESPLACDEASSVCACVTYRCRATKRAVEHVHTWRQGRHGVGV